MKAFGWYSSITVVPVIAAVTAAVLICAPPASFGTRRSIGAAAKLEITGAFMKTENRVRAKAGESLVGKGELGA